MSFSSTRLHLVRRLLKQTRQGFAMLAGMARETVIRVEQGQENVSAKLVRRFAEVSGFSEDFFYLGPVSGLDWEVGEPGVGVVAMKNARVLKGADREAALAWGEVLVLVHGWLEAKFQLPQDSWPDLRGVLPDQAARMLREHWGMGERPVGNLLGFLETRNVRVGTGSRILETGSFGFWLGQTPYLLLRPGLSGEQQRMELARELGQLVLYPHQPVRTLKTERDVERFAREFLLPATSFGEELRARRDLDTLPRTLKTRWGVPIETLLDQGLGLGIYTSWQHRVLMAEMEKRGWNVREPGGLSVESSLLWEKIKQVLSRKNQNLSSISQELFFPEWVLHELVPTKKSSASQPKLHPQNRQMNLFR